MPRLRSNIFNPREAWGSDELKKSKSKRRRILERISRFSSSPALAPRASTPQSHPQKNMKQTVSCVSLSSGSLSPGTSMITPPSTPGGVGFVSNMETESSLELFVECEEAPPVAQARTGPDWSALPEEVKVQVLGWLNPLELVKCSSVCREWHKLCFDGQLWSTLDASKYYNRIPVDQLAQLIVSAGPFVKHLNLRGCVQLQKDWRVEAVANACRNLTFASLEGCKFERSIVHFIILRNPRLTHLNLSGLKAVKNTTCRMIAQSCPNLETLNLSFCTEADGRGLRKIAERCKNLASLQACELNINDQGLMLALFKANALQKLCFGDCEALTDDNIQVLVEGVDPEIDPFTNRATSPPRKLSHLDLGKCSRLTDAALRHLSDKVPLLERLQLGGNPSFTDAGFAALLPTLPNIRHLDIEECLELTNTTLTNLSRSPAAKNLTHLHAGYCESLGDNGVLDVLRKSSNIESLELDNTRVSDSTLAEVARIVRARHDHPSPTVSLRLVIFDCANITWAGIREILVHNTETQNNHVVKMKCFYEYQGTVSEHTRLVLGGEVEKAEELENKWAEFMRSSEEAASGGTGGGMLGRRGRRRRDFDEPGGAPPRRRPRPTMGCAIM